MRAKMSRAQRAKQFMPFNALKGFDELTKNAEIIKEEPKTLDEEELEKLSLKLKNIKKRDVITITYYKEYGYTTISGMVSMIDFTFKKLKIIEEEIEFEKIIDIN